VSKDWIPAFAGVTEVAHCLKVLHDFSAATP
jgi:hypothetical protein